MTEQDQDAAIGRMVSRFSEAKKRRAALMAEANRIGQALGSAADALRGLDYYSAFWDGRRDGYSRTKTNYLGATYASPDEVKALLDDLRKTAEEIRELRPLLKDAGVVLE